MCLITLAWRHHTNYPLILLANRDEFFERPTAPLHQWEDSPVIGGRDLREGGTWLGITPVGKWAAVTNFRDPGRVVPNALSRGKLVLDYLESDLSPQDYFAEIKGQAEAFNGFNLLAGNMAEAYYFSNQEKDIKALTPGIYGLSNHLLDTPWPKVQRAKELFTQWLKGEWSPDHERAFELMADATTPPDSELPDTGVGIVLERILSPICIQSPAYGTRSTSVLVAGNDNTFTFAEKDRLTGSEVSLQIPIQPK